MHYAGAAIKSFDGEKILQVNRIQLNAFLKYNYLTCYYLIRKCNMIKRKCNKKLTDTAKTSN